MSEEKRDAFYHGIFPEGFAWSTATASYQIEGGYNEGGKSENIWDVFCRKEGNVFEGHTGNVACDSYHKFKEDIKVIKDLGATHYRFSLSWCRIIPDPFTGKINPAGVDYYNQLIDGLLAEGITPFVTLYHWDLPQSLQDIGGWLYPDLVQYFVDYARTCFESFGDRVKYWLTFNEPLAFVWLGYGTGLHPPGINEPLTAAWKAGHTVIKANTAAYRMYDKDFRSKQNGQIGVAFNTAWSEPKDVTSLADREAADRLLQMRVGWFAHPVYGDGDYPEILKAHLKKKAEELGFSDSPLPEFTAEEKEANKGASDYFGMNNYTTRFVTTQKCSSLPTNEAELMDVREDIDSKWDRGKSPRLYVVPWGLRHLLKWIKDTYGNPPVYITENGYSDDGGVEDQERLAYYRGYINEVLKAIRLDGCDVRGYTAWSLLDNFEWTLGYSERFGLHSVDYDDPERKRTPKASAKFYASVIKNNGFPK